MMCTIQQLLLRHFGSIMVFHLHQEGPLSRRKGGRYSSVRPLHYFDVNKTLISTLTPQLDEAKVESMYNWYTKRLYECERRDTSKVEKLSDFSAGARTNNVSDGVMKVSLVMKVLNTKIPENTNLVANN